LLPNAKKVNPAPLEMVDPATFEATFVSVAYDDLVLRDPRDSFDKVFGIPLTVDTLALYYNKSHFEDKIPSRGRPATTWDELKEDVFTLTKKDNSFERFEVAGIAMGRADNILRATDILYMLMVQYGAEFYNENISEAQFTKQNVTLPNGESVNPVSEALNTYSGFALPSNKHYSWNQYLANARSATKEIETFAEGKVSMIFGYSYLYEDLLNVVQDLQDRGEQTIDVEDIRISTVPQVVDPDTSTEKRDAYANYYVETVSRTSEHPEQAWDFLIFLASKENLEYYNEKTKKPTSRRDMIEDQMQDPVYGVYAQQIGFAESLKIIDEIKFDSIFTEAIDSVLATVKISDVVKLAEEKINAMLPDEGFIPPPPIIEE
jgi:ABC-type glycerol-3-phosphate transport system substrate-binding protein